MNTNFNGLKMRMISEPQKLSCSENVPRPNFQPRKSSCEVCNKTYWPWNWNKMMPGGIKVPGFSKVSIQIGYILLKHSVQFRTDLIY